MALYVNRMNVKINMDIQNNTYSPGVSFINDPKYGLQNLSISDKINILSSFSEFIAERVKKLLYNRVKSQYSYYNWAPLSKGYAAFKEKHNLSPNIWEATGLLINSIIVYKKGFSFMVGVDPNKKYPNSNVSVLFVAKCMEFGTKYMPARPLFGPVMRFIRRNIRKYWELFLLDEIMTEGRYNRHDVPVR